jgi:chorismate mutase/GNAT superfamily N-acetyltransferase
MTELLIRPAEPADAPAMAEVHVGAREANVGSMPPMVHDREATHRWLAERLERGSEGWVAERGGTVVGYLVLTRDWLDDLFLLPDACGQGIGTTLLDVAKSRRPDGFQLWVFATNTGARRFYARRGLVELETTDGSDNAERAPDVRLAWPGQDPLAFLRRQIDEVDEGIAGLLARRLALTAAVQRHKPVGGQAGRDPGREREIAERMAGHAPELGVERLQRIVHTIITESLEARGG